MRGFKAFLQAEADKTIAFQKHTQKLITAVRMLRHIGDVKLDDLNKILQDTDPKLHKLVKKTMEKSGFEGYKVEMFEPYDVDEWVEGEEHKVAMVRFNFSVSDSGPSGKKVTFDYYTSEGNQKICRISRTTKGFVVVSDGWHENHKW